LPSRSQRQAASEGWLLTSAKSLVKQPKKLSPFFDLYNSQKQEGFNGWLHTSELNASDTLSTSKEINGEKRLAFILHPLCLAQGSLSE
jgi:hypothetical protein